MRNDNFNGLLIELESADQWGAGELVLVEDGIAVDVCQPRFECPVSSLDGASAAATAGLHSSASFWAPPLSPRKSSCPFSLRGVDEQGEFRRTARRLLNRDDVGVRSLINPASSPAACSESHCHRRG